MRNIFLKIILFVAVIMAVSPLYAVSPPDNDVIFEEIINPDSPFYYPALMLRYNSGDMTLTNDDYRYLYYGYAYSDDYHPLIPIASEDRVLMVFERYGEEPDQEGMMDIIRHAKEVMMRDPFSPRNLNFLVYAYGAIGDTVNEAINYDRMSKVVAAIESTGTGETEKSPMHIIRFEHAADVLGMRGYSITKRLVVSKTTEYISVADEVAKSLNKGYYFDFSRIYWNAPDEIPQQERRWKINDYQLGGNNR